MDFWGRVTNVSGNVVTLSLESLEEASEVSRLLMQDKPEAYINIPDGRLISKTQRKKAYAIMGDISDWAGYGPEKIKELMKFHFEFETGHEYFSFASVDMTTAREFITFLLDFALKEHIQLKKTGLD
ncbi:putative HNHc nuclease [Weissella diestrammenae]|uniref:putative HNHc nuclease n=1 Tax=Weissella diestrammenae TaxID=1162633 RepID=UPI002030ACE3|nr:putative HNHc nuclease [Weissella diestrammenae]